MSKSPLRFVLLRLISFTALSLSLAMANHAVAADLAQPDRLIVKKSERRLYLIKDRKVLKSYHISLGQNPIGHKRREGDNRTPEGTYLLDWKNSGSKFYRSIHISYPNKRDRMRAKVRGLTPGGDIMLHGLPNDRGEKIFRTNGPDWTNGCIALSNEDMEEVWSIVEEDIVIEIRP